MPESAGLGVNIGDPVVARDDEGDTLTYALGSHEDIFGIVGTSGQLLTSGTLNHESTPSYLVTVTVSDGKAADGTVDTTIDDSAEVTVAITDVNEPPEVVGPATATWPETQNRLMPVASYLLVDPENDTGTRWSVAGLDAAGLFAINGAGRLFFLSKPNFESPTDQDGNNTYLITVSNTAGGHSAALDVIVTVTNEDEPPTITGASRIYHPETRPNPVATYSRATRTRS